MAVDFFNDKALISAIKKGDKKAYNKLYLNYCDKLCKYVYSLSPNQKQAEDIVQDTLIDIWIKREKLNIKTSLNNYLYRSVHNRFINIYRKEIKKQSTLNNLYIEAIEELDDLEESTKENRLKALERAINNLPPKRKDIFILSKLKNYKHKEIATMRNISESTIQTQIRKAMITIRKDLLELSLIGVFSTFFILNSHSEILILFP